MLFPTSFAPLPKASMNNTPSPRSAVRDISGAHSTLFRRNTSGTIGRQKRPGDICGVILSLVQHGADPYSIHVANDATNTNAPNSNRGRCAYPFEGSTAVLL